MAGEVPGAGRSATIGPPSGATATDPYSAFGSQYGYYSDSETGLELLGYRYYDPSQGRFVNRDPIGMAGGVNVYGYTQNGPVDGEDPEGLERIIISIGKNGFGTGEVIADPGDRIPIHPHKPGDPWWPGHIRGGTKKAKGGEIIVGPFPVSNRPTHGKKPFPAGTHPIVGFKPGNKFKRPVAYGPGGVVVGGTHGDFIHGHGPWDPRTGNVGYNPRTWKTPTHGCIRSRNGIIEQIGDIIWLNPRGGKLIVRR